MTMTRDDAEALRAAASTEARALSRTTKNDLAAIERSELEARGIVRLAGTLSKDELIASVLRLRGFGTERMNEASHVLFHDVPWSACSWCQDVSMALAEHTAPALDTLKP